MFLWNLYIINPTSHNDELPLYRRKENYFLSYLAYKGDWLVLVLDGKFHKTNERGLLVKTVLLRMD